MRMAKINRIEPEFSARAQLSAEMMEAMNNYDGAVVQLKKAVELAPRQAGLALQIGRSVLRGFRNGIRRPGSIRRSWRTIRPTATRIGELGSVINPEGRRCARGVEGDGRSRWRLCPNLTEARADRGRALLRLGKSAMPFRNLQAAIKADPMEPRNHFLLAKAYRATGRQQEAQAEMQTFSKLDEAARAATAERAQEVIKNKETAR